MEETQVVEIQGPGLGFLVLFATFMILLGVAGTLATQKAIAKAIPPTPTATRVMYIERVREGYHIVDHKWQVDCEVYLAGSATCFQMGSLDNVDTIIGGGR